MPYTILEAKIRLPHARKSTQLLSDPAVHHIKLAHPKYKNYYLLCVSENERETTLDKYKTIGQLNIIQQVATAELSDLIQVARNMEMEIIEANNAPYSEEQNQTQRDTSNSEDNPTLHSHIICQGQTFSAKLDYTSVGFHIRFGSRLRKDVTASWKGTAAYRQRAQLVKDGVLKPKGKHLIMMADYLCKSPSTAASMIRGASSNGWTALKYDDGSRLIQGKYTYREFDEISG